MPYVPWDLVLDHLRRRPIPRWRMGVAHPRNEGLCGSRIDLLGAHRTRGLGSVRASHSVGPANRSGPARSPNGEPDFLTHHTGGFFMRILVCLIAVLLIGSEAEAGSGCGVGRGLFARLKARRANTSSCQSAPASGSCAVSASCSAAPANPCGTAISQTPPSIMPGPAVPTPANPGTRP